MDIARLASDLFLMIGALGATVYCIVLSRRLRRFNDLETGVGGAIAVLSAQVDDMTRSLEAARKIAQSSALSLDGLTERAESASRRLELLVATLHDLPEDRPQPAAPVPVTDGAVLFASRRSSARGAA